MLILLYITRDSNKNLVSYGAHGVPAADLNNWKYSWGTSFSTPYMVAGALIAILGYNEGHYHRTGSFKSPTASITLEILKSTASLGKNNDWNQYLGWGYFKIR
jgi:hypothetical protein